MSDVGGLADALRACRLRRRRARQSSDKLADTVLAATRRRSHLRLYHGRIKPVLDLATPEAVVLRADIRLTDVVTVGSYAVNRYDCVK